MGLNTTQAAYATHAAQATSWSIPMFLDALVCNGWSLLELIKAYKRNSLQTTLCPCEFLSYLRGALLRICKSSMGFYDAA